MRLFFDIETTGQADFQAASTAPHQPRIVQLAALLTEDDGTERGSLSVLIEPEGWEIPAEATAVHGITTEMAAKAGVPIGYALATFAGFCFPASELVAHNIDYDAFVMEGELRRIEREFALAGLFRFCTMKAAKPVCKLPGPDGEYKRPGLSEAYRHLFGEELQGAHDAMADTRACARIFFELRRLSA